MRARVRSTKSSRSQPVRARAGGAASSRSILLPRNGHTVTVTDAARRSAAGSRRGLAGQKPKSPPKSPKPPISPAADVTPSRAGIRARIRARTCLGAGAVCRAVAGGVLAVLTALVRGECGRHERAHESRADHVPDDRAEDRAADHRAHARALRSPPGRAALREPSVRSMNPGFMYSARVAARARSCGFDERGCSNGESPADSSASTC